MSDRKKFFWIAAFFLTFYFIPEGNERVLAGLAESVAMMADYAREHVLLCLIPAFFIAGAISVFVSQQSVMKYLGAKAKKWIAYSVASVSGTVLAVCSCTVLPLFAGIYTRGAGL
ncbi:MAG TPA: permease, partial [Aminobacteriaceae bacterium]|nr:permease [Aminobacteriaceae bacterium]